MSENSVTRDQLEARQAELNDAIATVRAGMDEVALGAAEGKPGAAEALVRQEAEMSRHLRERTAIEAALRAYDRRSEVASTEAAAAKMEAAATEARRVAREAVAAWQAVERAAAALGDAFGQVQRLGVEALRCTRSVHLAVGGHLDSPAIAEGLFDGDLASRILGTVLWGAVGQVQIERPIGGVQPAAVLAGHIECIAAAGDAIAGAAERVASQTRTEIKTA